MTGAVLSMFTLYRDPAAAVRWLEEVLGFEAVNSWGPEDGVIAHAELRLGDAVVLVQQAAEGQGAPEVVERSTVRAPVLCLGDDAAVDTLFARAEAHGATVLVEPETTAWGNHRFELLDPEGFQWSVGSYVPGAAWE